MSPAVLYLVLGCAEPEPAAPEPTVPADTDVVPDDTDTTPPTTPPEPTDTDTPPVTTGLLYPPAPYDCAAGVLPGPLAWRYVEGVTTTEDLAFDTEGWLVASDAYHNLQRFAPDGTREILSPGVGENRGIDVLPDGDVVFTNPITGEVNRVASTGAVSRYTGVPSGVSGIDVAADGTVALGDLGGWPHVADGAGGVTDWGRLLLQGYGTAFSADEERIWFASGASSEPAIYVTERAADGSWPEPVPWARFSAFGLSGLATDACDNLYAMEAVGCRLWRFDPDGNEELLLDLPIENFGFCPALAFGRGLGGWDAYKLYVSTYDVLVEVDVGVPGRPR